MLRELKAKAPPEVKAWQEQAGEQQREPYATWPKRDQNETSRRLFGQQTPGHSKRSAKPATPANHQNRCSVTYERKFDSRLHKRYTFRNPLQAVKPLAAESISMVGIRQRAQPPSTTSV